MLNKQLFVLAHQVGDINFYPMYKKLVRNQWKSYEELKEEQERQLRYMINFAYKNVRYYHNIFDELKIAPEDIKRIEDLTKLPILTKEVIKSNWGDFKPISLNKMKYYEWDTGGTTGTPFKYRLTKFDRFIGGALLYRGWGYGGYELGDKMVFLAGSSLDVGVQSNISKTVHEVMRNLKKLSSFDMGEKEMRKYVDLINSFKPKFIRGYASSIYFLSKWIDENNLKIHQPLAVFTTAEKLYPHMREKIELVLNCDVYDTYGVNDGGVSCYECSEHRGLHIDTERGILEVVDEEGNQLENGDGKIIATSLYNFSMPFIRYDTGDIGTISNDKCECGREYKLLKELVGRTVDILLTPEGNNVHGWFFSKIVRKYKGIREFQVVQDKLDKLIIKIVPEKEFDEKQLESIRKEIMKKSKSWTIEFKYADKIERTDAGKYKFIINKIH